MAIGVSTACFYPMPTEEAFSLLGAAGVRTAEIFFNSPRELEPGFLNQLARTQERYGISVRAVHPFTSGFEPFLLFSEYERRFEDGLQYYRRYFEAARLLGAAYVILHGEREDPVITHAEYFRRFARLSELGAGYGVTLLQENVNKFSSQSPDFICKMADALPQHAAFTLDLKQAVRAGHSPHDLAQAMGQRLRHVHVSDHANAESCLLPGRGRFDFAGFFSWLKQTHPDVDCILEVYRSAYRDAAEVLASAQFLSGLYDGSATKQ